MVSPREVPLPASTVETRNGPITRVPLLPFTTASPSLRSGLSAPHPGSHCQWSISAISSLQEGSVMDSDSMQPSGLGFFSPPSSWGSRRRCGTHGPSLVIAEENSTVRRCHGLFNQTPTPAPENPWVASCFWLFQIKVVCTRGNRFLWELEFSCLWDKCPRLSLPGHMGSSFIRNCQNAFQSRSEQFLKQDSITPNSSINMEL